MFAVRSCRPRPENLDGPFPSPEDPVLLRLERRSPIVGPQAPAGITPQIPRPGHRAWRRVLQRAGPLWLAENAALAARRSRRLEQCHLRATGRKGVAVSPHRRDRCLRIGLDVENATDIMFALNRHGTTRVGDRRGLESGGASLLGRDPEGKPRHFSTTLQRTAFGPGSV